MCFNEQITVRDLHIIHFTIHCNYKLNTFQFLFNIFLFFSIEQRKTCMSNIFIKKIYSSEDVLREKKHSKPIHFNSINRRIW